LKKITWKIPKEYYDYFETLYKENQNVKVTIDVMVENIVGGGFEIVPSAEGQEEIVEEIKKFNERIELPRLLFEIVKDMLVYGNAFYETVIEVGKGITEVKHYHPKTICIVTDTNWNIVEFLKVEDDKVIRRFKANEIAHFSNSSKKGPYGRSQIELLIPTLKKESDQKDIPEL